MSHRDDAKSGKRRKPGTASLEQLTCDRLQLSRREMRRLRALPSRVTLAYLADCLTRQQLKLLLRAFECKGADKFFWDKFKSFLNLKI